MSDSKVGQTNGSGATTVVKATANIFCKLRLCFHVQVIRIWKEEDMLLDKVFKATVSLTTCMQLVAI